MPSETLSHRALVILAQFRGNLHSGSWPPGFKLPREVDLAEHHGVSRPTLRKIIRILEREGRLQVRQGSGTRVLAKKVVRGPIAIMDCTDPELTRMAVARIAAAGRRTLVFDHGDNWSPTAEHLWFDHLLQVGASGLLAVGTPNGGADRAAFAQLAGAGVQVIHLEHFDETIPDQEWCLPDYAMGGRIIAQRLLAAGCRQLAWMDICNSPFVVLARGGFLAAAGSDARQYRPVWGGAAVSGHPDQMHFLRWLERLPPGTGVGFSDCSAACWFSDQLASRPDLHIASLRFQPNEPVGPCRIVLQVPRRHCVEAAVARILGEDPHPLRRWAPWGDDASA
ncbi:MAG: GntR family transcriptional regulator [Planctomycetes bacterium]|nr:GntR family transcriptional regulator [Planctomycetota bacterium]